MTSFFRLLPKAHDQRLRLKHINWQIESLAFQLRSLFTTWSFYNSCITAGAAPNHLSIWRYVSITCEQDSEIIELEQSSIFPAEIHGRKHGGTGSYPGCFILGCKLPKCPLTVTDHWSQQNHISCKSTILSDVTFFSIWLQAFKMVGKLKKSQK